MLRVRDDPQARRANRVGNWILGVSSSVAVTDIGLTSAHLLTNPKLNLAAGLVAIASGMGIVTGGELKASARSKTPMDTMSESIIFGRILRNR